jgi:hypothetical protein
MKELKTTFKQSAKRARCPLHPKEYCWACQYGVTGPQDCPIVYLAMADYDTRVEWAKRRLAEKAAENV